MIRFLAIFFMLPLQVFGISYHCPTDGVMHNEEALNEAYEKAEIVFLANVTLDNEDVNRTRWQYSVITPVLKGEVEPEGFLDHGTNPCDFMETTLKGVYLIFWEKQNDPVTNKNTKLTVYGNSKVIEEWVLNWAESKTHNKESNATP